MIDVLIVDDDTEKVRSIIECLSEAGVTFEHIDECRDANSAKIALQKKSYDLVVLDVVIPDRIDQEPTAESGIKLLAEISRREKYCAPDHIIGLTAYPEAYAKAQQEFANRSWGVIRYDRTREDWSHYLKTKAEQILWARQSAQGMTRDYASQLAVVCALDDPELRAILKLPWNWEKWREPGDPTIYFKGQYGSSGCIVHAAASARMGMTAAAIIATKMISAFRPRYIANVGIAASFSGRANFGDVLAADLSWDYGSGKFGTVDGVGQFFPAPNQHQLSADLRSKLLEMARDDVGMLKISSAWPANRPPTQLHIVLGPVASGAAVVADNAKIKEIASQHRKLVGIEMETYAIFDAAAESAVPRPMAFSLKGVSDFADSQKDDRFQLYAAYTSAECLRYLAETHLA